MKKRNIVQFTIVTLVLSILITACTLPNNQGNNLTEENELHVAAASDLRFAFEELGRTFEEEKGVKVIFQFGSSGNLAQQIANGAPIDLFASANKKFVEDLVESGDIIEETKALYAIGRIVLAVNKNAHVDVKSLEDLLLDEIQYISLANPNHAPYGLAGKEALESKGLWELVKDKLVYGENVSQAMQFVQTGNAPVGIIALSIADVEEIDHILIDEDLHKPLEQMLGVVSHSNNRELAESFAVFVNSPEGRKIMEKYGFYLP
ncbi:MAG: molybdate ABC transporter substrate-binding protein [Clostridiaceae bacterium]|nr:molybdate ABC transporter substrate-binding protein [Clostridiaceae bacterium]